MATTTPVFVPNAGGQPGTIPVGTAVVTSSGYVYRRGLPVANLYGSASPLAAQLRAQGEGLAQQDYAAAAGLAQQAPQPQGQQTGGTASGSTGSGSTEQRLDSIAAQQVQLHQRVNCLERPRQCH